MTRKIISAERARTVHPPFGQSARRLRDSGIKPFIPGKNNRIGNIRHDEESCKQRWRVEAAIGRLKDCRRVATRYDKLARTFRDTVARATLYMFWM